MPEQCNAAEAGIEPPAGGQRKPWQTPRVIVSSTAYSEAKGPPTAEISPTFFSATKHTGS